MRMRVTWLGKDVGYAAGMGAMRRAIEALQDAPAAAPAAAPDASPQGELLLLEHRATITVTRTGGLAFVRTPPAELAAAGIELVETDRGGDVTFHGPGQLVGYPVVRLLPGPTGRPDLLAYLRALESGLVAACEAWGIRGAHRREGYTGVWIASDPGAPAERWPHDDRAAKLIAIGVGVKEGITRHGFAWNVRTELARFTRHIVPCGLVGRPVTSLQQLATSGALPPEGVPEGLAAEARFRAHVAQHVAAALGFAGAGEESPAMRH